MSADRPRRLTGAEREAARRAGMSDRRYAALKRVRTIDDWNALTKREREQGRGRSG